MPAHCPYVTSEVVKAMRMLSHGTIRTAPYNNLPVDLTEMPIPPSAFMGLEGLDIWAKGALVLRLVPVGSFRFPQSFGLSGGRQQKVSLGEALLSQQSVALWSRSFFNSSATAQLKIMARVFSLYTLQRSFSHASRLSQAFLLQRKPITCLLCVLRLCYQGGPWRNKDPNTSL